MGKGDCSRDWGKFYPAKRGKDPPTTVLPHMSWVNTAVRTTRDMGDADTGEWGTAKEAAAQPSPRRLCRVSLT